MGSVSKKLEKEDGIDEEADLKKMQVSYIKKIKQEIKERSRANTSQKRGSILQMKFHAKLNKAIKDKVDKSIKKHKEGAAISDMI